MADLSEEADFIRSVGEELCGRAGLSRHGEVDLSAGADLSGDADLRGETDMSGEADLSRIVDLSRS